MIQGEIFLTENTHEQKTLPTIEEILRGTEHSLTIFKPNAANDLDIFLKRGTPYVKCFASGKDRRARPEEIVRQLYVKMLLDDYGYPVERIALEKPVQFGSAVHEKAADIVVWDKDDPNTAYIIIECKKPKRSDGLEQLKSYCHAEGAPSGVWTNGGETIILHRRDPNYFQNLPDIPRASQTLSELLGERWTLEDLSEYNVLVKEQTTLKKIILDMENLVLANAGVDAFEEVFKLIYAKLYDEAQAAQGGRQRRYLQFRVGGATPNEFKQGFQMTQRLCRIEQRKPILLRWKDLHEMFGGQSSPKRFKQSFPDDLKIAHLSYPEARIEEHKEGYLFRASHPPVPKTQLLIK